MQMGTTITGLSGHLLVALLFVAVNLATSARLVCYRRRGARYRPGMSAVAYLLAVFTGGQALDVLIRHGQLTHWQSGVTPWQLGISVLLAILVFRARGNVAAIGKNVRARPQ
ncbi:phage holin family protein [Bordetella bronchiseptica]